MIGYAIHAAGAVAEIFGLHVSLILSIPGGLFELALGVWLLSKGIELRRPSVKSQDDPVVLMAAV